MSSCMNLIRILPLFAALAAFPATAQDRKAAPSPGEIVAAAPAGDWVDITSLYVGESSDDVQQRRAERFLLVAYDIPRGCLASYYPETNALVPLESFSLVARTPTSKSIPVMLTAHAGPAAADAA